MNLKLLDSILLGILALGVPLVDTRNIPASALCRNVDFPGPCFNLPKIPGGPVVRIPVSDDIVNNLDKRGGGGRPGKPKFKEGESGGASSGSNGETGEGQRVGVAGGNDESQARVGGSDDQGGGRTSGDTSDTQGGGRVSGGSKTPPNEESVPGGQWQKSKRNNDNTPAQNDQLMVTNGQFYDEAVIRAAFEKKLESETLKDARNFFFYSGTWPLKAVEELRPLYAARLKDPEGRLEAPTAQSVEDAKIHLPAMNDIRDPPKGPHRGGLTDADILEMDYYWAANSKAYAQAVKGDAILAIRLDRNINQAQADDRASFWWTWEIPELTRNPNIDNIKIIAIDPKHQEFLTKPDPSDIGKPITIWSKGDPPLSYPADLKHAMARPKEGLSYDEVFDGNTKAKAPPEWESIRESFGPAI